MIIYMHMHESPSRAAIAPHVKHPDLFSKQYIHTPKECMSENDTTFNNLSGRFNTCQGLLDLLQCPVRTDTLPPTTRCGGWNLCTSPR